MAGLWSGIGRVVVGMERQGYALSLKKYGNGDGAWVASFNSDAMTASAGFGSGPTPWRAVQQAAWATIKRPPTSDRLTQADRRPGSRT